MDKEKEQVMEIEHLKGYADYTPKDIKAILGGNNNLEKARLMIEDEAAKKKGAPPILSEAQHDSLRKLSEADRYEINFWLDLIEPIARQRYNWGIIYLNLQNACKTLYTLCEIWDLAEYNARSYNIVLKAFQSPEVYRVKLDKLTEEIMKNNLEKLREKYERYNFVFDEAQDGSISLNLDSVYKTIDETGALPNIRRYLSYINAITEAIEVFIEKFPKARLLLPSDIAELLMLFDRDLAHEEKYSRREWRDLKAEKRYKEAKRIEPYAIFPDYSEVGRDEDLYNKFAKELRIWEGK